MTGSARHTLWNNPYRIRADSAVIERFQVKLGEAIRPLGIIVNTDESGNVLASAAAEL